MTDQRESHVQVSICGCKAFVQQIGGAFSNCRITWITERCAACPGKVWDVTGLKR